MPLTKNQEDRATGSDKLNEEVAPTTPEWVVLIDAHLRRAAALAIEHGVGTEGFIRACGIVYDETDPEQRLRAQLEELRQHGVIGTA